MTDPDHRLTQEDLDLFKDILATGQLVRDLLERVNARNHAMAQEATEGPNAKMLVRLAQAEPAVWYNRARDHLQVGFACLQRSVTKPIHF